MNEYYGYLSEEEQSSYENWWNELTVEEYELVDNGVENQIIFLVHAKRKQRINKKNRTNELIHADELER